MTLINLVGVKRGGTAGRCLPPPAWGCGGFFYGLLSRSKVFDGTPDHLAEEAFDDSECGPILA